MPATNHTVVGAMSSLATGSKRPPREDRQKKSLSPAEFSDLKSKSTCHVCQQKGHWATDVDKCKAASTQQKAR